MSKKTPLDTSKPKVPGEEETPKQRRQLLYTAIAYHTTKRKLLHFVLPSIALFVGALLLCKFLLADGMEKIDAIGIAVAVFVFYSWFAFTIAWPLLGQRFLLEVETLFGPRTREGLWEQFYTKTVKRTGLDVFATAKSVNEYDTSNWVKLNKAAAKHKTS